MASVAPSDAAAAAAASPSPSNVAAVAPAAANGNGTNSKGAAAAASPLPSFSLVVAATQSGGIGRAGGLPWPNGALAADMARFKALTLGQAESSAAAATATGEQEKGRLLNTVIMGRKTWDSIPTKFRPLPGRINIVLTRQANEWAKELSTPKENTYVAASLHDALALVRTLPQASTADGSVFVIGGAALYREGLASPLCHTIHLTRVLREFDVDTHFHIGDGLAGGERSEWIMAHVGDVQVGSAATGAVPFQFQTLERRVKSYELGNAEEQQYLDLVRRVMEQGTLKGDRTGTGTLSLFGAQMRFSLRDGRFPLLTSKRVFWRGVVEELLWLIRGCTDSKALAAKKVHIWDDNGTRAFLDKLGFKEREEGDLGPVYGFQWRHFGAQYQNCHSDYSGQGVDQLAQVIHTIKTNPNDRRIIMNAWNPIDLPKMALPPCHVMAQFYVANGELSCQMYQRSCDLGLGVPFNIASYSLLTVLVAHVCGLRPGEFVHTLADAHVYTNHVDALKEQLQRTPRPFPTLRIKRNVTNIDEFTFDDFELQGYKPLDAIKMQMAV